jgi:FkbH-like protein
MTLAQALQIVHTGQSLPDAAPFDVALACGFTPLHLQTFFDAYLQNRLPERKIRQKSGIFGDLFGNIKNLKDLNGAAVVIEWTDLDPRLGFRQLGGWKPSQMSSLIAGFDDRLRQIESAIRAAAAQFPVVVVLPTLRLPPAFLPVNARSSVAALALHASVSCFAARLAEEPSVAVVNSEELDRLSPAAARYDSKADLLAGFPYSVAHAEVVGRVMAEALLPAAPKKGLITDLDDTLWAGIVGEVGPQGVSWDLERHSQLHGIYQQLLDSLADQGVLLGVASKNDIAVVEQTLRERDDLLAPHGRMFPWEVHWEPKSESVNRILRAWNIGADSVVFLDDSPLEVAEVQAAFPAMECLVFPKKDHAAAIELFYGLRNRFGKNKIEADDALRLESIRQTQVFQEAASSGERQEEFLEGLEAVIKFTVNPPLSETRILELVNKTNQFNLNGIRYDEATWRRMHSEPGAVTVGVAYKDKFGSLGTIAVLYAKVSGASLDVRAWVMSCRAFSRRIEHRTLQFLMEHLGVERVTFAFQPTSKNGPTRTFLTAVSGAEPAGQISLDTAIFRKNCPRLAHRLEVKENEAVTP